MIVRGVAASSIAVGMTLYMTVLPMIKADWSSIVSGSA